MKKKKLEFYVLNDDFNNKKIVKYNVLSRLDLDDIKKKLKNKTIHDYASFKEYIDKEFKYYYRSRSEYEILVGGLFSKNYEKIDIYTQAVMNLDLIVKYVLEELDIKFKEE